MLAKVFLKIFLVSNFFIGFHHQELRLNKTLSIPTKTKKETNELRKGTTCNKLVTSCNMQKTTVDKKTISANYFRYWNLTSIGQNSSRNNYKAIHKTKRKFKIIKHNNRDKSKKYNFF